MSIFAKLIVVCLAAGSPSPRLDVTPPAETVQVAGESFSKLRKIHLVRPDLIAYPLVIDFIC